MTTQERNARNNVNENRDIYMIYVSDENKYLLFYD